MRKKRGALSFLAPSREHSLLSSIRLATGETVFHHACKLGLEGIVSKRKDSPYRSERAALSGVLEAMYLEWCFEGLSVYFTKSLTRPAWLGLLGMALRREPSRSGSARLGRFQKDGLPSRSWGN